MRQRRKRQRVSYVAYRSGIELRKARKLRLVEFAKNAAYLGSVVLILGAFVYLSVRK